jgi:CubicO group peptidase (beta-lactamase class C family)
MRLSTLVVSTIMVFTAQVSAQTQAPTPPAAPAVNPAWVAATLKGLVDRGELVSASALVEHQGKEVFFGAYGFADREAGKTMQRDTLVQIFSMTKPIVGVTLMTLYDQGKFQWDDPLEKYLPEFANMRVYAGQDAQGKPVYEAAKRPITIRDLGRHTAGFGDRGTPGPVGDAFRAADPLNFENNLSQLVAKMASVPLLYQPGTRWLYSNSVDVQARLAERLSGKPFAQYLNEAVLQPLGMTSTRYTVLPDDKDRVRLAALYQRKSSTEFQREPDATAYRFNGKAWPQTPGSFGLVSTLDDYIKFTRMLLNQGSGGGARILKPETVRLMATDTLPADITDSSWLKPGKGGVGFGYDFAVRITPPVGDEPAGAMGEFFWDGAANTLFWVDPQNQLTAVFFTQFLPPSNRAFAKIIRDAVYINFPNARPKLNW